MIVTEYLPELPDAVMRYSDQGFLIRQDQTGIDYIEAVDGIDAPYTYTETDIPIEQPEPEPEPEYLSAEQALDIMLGGEEG